MKTLLPNVFEERLAQVTGACDRSGFKPRFNGYAVETSDQVSVLNAYRAAFADFQVFTDQPAPL